jgi:hypothetical protein
MKLLIKATLLFVTGIPWLLWAQSRPAASSPRQALAALRGQARDAYTNKDYPKLRDLLLQQNRLLNGSPRVVYNLACAAALSGNKEEALRWLGVYTRMGQIADLQKEADLATLAGDPRFTDLLKTMERNKLPISHSTAPFKISDPELLTEDLAYDASTRSFYVSSVLTKKIIRINAKGEESDFAKGLPWPPVAVSVDSRRKVLWATTVAIEHFADVSEKDWGKSELRKFDLKTGRELARFAVDDGKQNHALGDMAVTSEGDVIVSDGESGGVYMLRDRATALEKLSEEFISPQTPAIHPDGRHVFIPDYARGIALLDLRTRAVRWLQHPEDVMLNGIDGLYFHDGTLLAVQNGSDPERVVRIQLSPSLDSVTSLEVIESNTPTLGDPTHGVIVDNDFYFIANSGWSELDDNGHLKPGKKLTNALVMRFALKKAALSYVECLRLHPSTGYQRNAKRFLTEGSSLLPDAAPKP